LETSNKDNENIEKVNTEKVNTENPIDKSHIWGITVAAIIVFGILFGIFWLKEADSNGRSTPDIVIMGDSIFANTTDETSIANQMARKLDKRIADFSFGGTCVSYIDKNGRLDNANDAFCMSALTKAIIAKDFRYQQNARVTYNAADYFGDRVEMLSDTEFLGVDVLIMDYMLNDYQIAVPIENSWDQYSEYTYEGAYREVLKQLRDNYPRLRIILLAPVKTWYGDERVLSSEYDIGGGTIDKYMEAQKALAEEFKVEWVSLYEVYDRAVAKNPKLLKDENGNPIEMWEAFTYDNIHPNDVAREIIADYLVEYLSYGE